MDMATLLKKVNDTIQEHPSAEIDSVEDLLVLKVDKDWTPMWKWERLFGDHGPWVKVMGAHAEGHTTAVASARRVRDWMVEHGKWEEEDG